LRPSATGRIEFSAKLLDSSTCSYSKQRSSFDHMFSVYAAAFPQALWGSCRCLISDRAVPGAELADAKRSIVAGFVFSLENPDAVLSRWILPEGYWDTYTQKVNAVSADDGRSFTGYELARLRRVSTTLRHSEVEFSEYSRLSFVVC